MSPAQLGIQLLQRFLRIYDAVQAVQFLAEQWDEIEAVADSPSGIPLEFEGLLTATLYRLMTVSSDRSVREYQDLIQRVVREVEFLLDRVQQLASAVRRLELGTDALQRDRVALEVGVHHLRASTTQHGENLNGSLSVAGLLTAALCAVGLLVFRVGRRRRCQ